MTMKITHTYTKRPIKPSECWLGPLVSCSPHEGMPKRKHTEWIMWAPVHGKKELNARERLKFSNHFL